MLRIGRKMGGGQRKPGAPPPQSLHEAAKAGDTRWVQSYLGNRQPLDMQDQFGITPLGWAIGANQIAVVKLLLDGRANPFAVDSSGNGALHYAAGYGRMELLEVLFKAGASVNQSNAQGQTPLAVAELNRQSGAISALQAKGGKA